MSDPLADSNDELDRVVPGRLPHFTGAMIAPLIEIQIDLAETPNSVKQNWKTIMLPWVPGSQELVMIGEQAYLCQGRRYVVDKDGRTNAKVCILLVQAGQPSGLVRAPASGVVLAGRNGQRRN